jgi:hypothetical protein
VGAFGDTVLPEHDRKGPKGVGLYGVDPDLKEGAMECFDDVGSGCHEDLVAPFKIGAAKVVRAEVAKLEVGAGGPIEDDDSLREGGQIGVVGLRTLKRRSKYGLHWIIRLLVMSGFTTLRP